jgi:hypothetical protein
MDATYGLLENGVNYMLIESVETWKNEDTVERDAVQYDGYMEKRVRSAGFTQVDKGERELSGPNRKHTRK